VVGVEEQGVELGTIVVVAGGNAVEAVEQVVE
jgi:hypothetical protein